MENSGKENEQKVNENVIETEKETNIKARNNVSCSDN